LGLEYWLDLVGLTSLATVPALALLALFYWMDRYEPEPRAWVARAVLIGVLVLPPALWWNREMSRWLGWELLTLGGFRGDLAATFLVAAMPEEMVKFAAMSVFVYRWKEFDEPYDGILYGAALALGFALVENLFYVYGAWKAGAGAYKLAFLRGVLSVPAHALYGATMGAGLGKAKFPSGGRTRLIGWVVALLLPWFFHGLFDLLCLFLGRGGWWGLVGLSVVMWGVVLWRVARALAASPFKPTHLEGDGTGGRDGIGENERTGGRDPTGGR